MTKVAGLEGSYTEKKRKGVPTGKFTVKFCTGWNDETKRYDEVKRSVDNEKEAIAMMASVTNFLNAEGGDPSEVAAFLDRAKARREQDVRTVDQVCEEFLAERRLDPDVSKRTVDTNETHVKRVRPFVGNRIINAMTPEEAQRLLYDIRDIGNPLNEGRPASGTYANKIYATMKQVWEFARRKGYVDANIFKAEDVKAPQRDTEEKEPLSVEQAEAVMANLLDHDMDAFETGLFLLMSTGMRLSEMLALTWMEYDEVESILHVRHSMERDTQERKSTKTKETRTIPLMPAAKTVLLEWRSRQQAYFKARGLRWSKGHPICHNSKGTHILSSTYERWWRNNRDRLGVPEFATLHTMRHTFATILIVNCGVDTSTAQSLTGHTKPDVLLQIYTHTHQGAKTGAMAKLEGFMFPYKGEHDCAHCKHWSASPDPSDFQGVCWAKTGKTAKVFDGTHTCELDAFEFKAAG